MQLLKPTWVSVLDVLRISGRINNGSILSIIRSLDGLMMEPKGLDPIAEVTVRFAHKLMRWNERLEEELKMQKGSRTEPKADRLIDYIGRLRMPKIYEKLPRERQP